MLNQETENSVRQPIANMIMLGETVDDAIYCIRAKHAAWVYIALANHGRGKELIADYYYEKANIAVTVRWELEELQHEEIQAGNIFRDGTIRKHL